MTGSGRSETRYCNMMAVAPLSGGTVGALIGLAAAQEQLLLLILVATVASVLMGLLLVPRLLSILPFHEIRRWGFVIVVTAAIVGSIAAWLTFRPLFPPSDFCILASVLALQHGSFLGGAFH